MGIWIKRHLWQIGLALLAVGGWVAQVQGAVNDVAEIKASIPLVVEQQAALKWSLDSLRLEVSHMNRNLEELLRRNP